jgi:exosortase
MSKSASFVPARFLLGRVDAARMVAILAVLLIVCYWQTISATAVLLTDSEDMAHGFFAPFVAGALLWIHKDRVAAGISEPSIWAIPLLAIGALIAIPASLGASTTLSRFGLLLSLAGCTLVIGGMPLLKAVRFPLALLLYTFPIPAVLYGEITMPLQLLASRLAEMSFELLGYSVLREGNIIELPNQRLSVVEACSGLRSLVTLSFFTAAYSYVMEDRNWVRFLLFATAIPSAIFINGLRITLTGVLGRINPEWTKGTVHDITGWVCFAIGFGIVLLMHMFVKREGKEKQRI